LITNLSYLPFVFGKHSIIAVFFSSFGVLQNRCPYPERVSDSCGSGLRTVLIHARSPFRVIAWRIHHIAVLFSSNRHLQSLCPLLGYFALAQRLAREVMQSTRQHKEHQYTDDVCDSVTAAEQIGKSEMTVGSCSPAQRVPQCVCVVG
jgi:hypothetical protein